MVVTYSPLGQLWADYGSYSRKSTWNMVDPFVFRRENIFQGALDLCGPCNGATLSRRALSTMSLTEDSR
jgi:hypothetical protein